MPIARVSALRYLWLVIIFALISISYNTTPAQAAAYVARGSGGPQCNVIYWLYANGYSQVELLNHSWKEMHYLRWTPDNSTAFKMRWRNGKTQSFTLRQPGKNLRQVSFFCQSEGFINLQVTDCRTKQPLCNALISDSTGKQFRGFPTKKDGWGVVPCNCNGRLPQKVSIKVSRSGYQSATGKVLFSDKAITRYRICLNASVPAASTPASPWTAWRGHNYRVITTKMTWNQAQAYAQKLGGHLVTISDKAENDFVADLARGRGISRQSWLGFTDQGSEGRWRWVNNQKVTYTNWHSGEPNNSHGSENCAMVGWHSKYSWNDGACNEKMGFVVETGSAGANAGQAAAPKAAEGDWKWFTGGKVRLAGGGGVYTYDQNQGKWNASSGSRWYWKDAATRTIVISWNNNNYIDTLVLSKDGNRLDGKNQNGSKVSGTRLTGQGQSKDYWGKPRALKTAVYTWKGSKKDFARLSNNFVFKVGMGGHKWGYGYAGVLLAGVKVVNLSIVSAPKTYNDQDHNSFAGFVVDYGVGNGFAKRVYLGIGMMHSNRSGGFDQEPASPQARQFVNMGRHAAYQLDLSRWAPSGWNGKTWFYVGVANIGANKSLKAQITSVR